MQAKLQDLGEKLEEWIGPFELAKASVANNDGVKWNVINGLNELLTSISPVDFQDHDNLIYEHKMIETSNIEVEISY